MPKTVLFINLFAVICLLVSLLKSRSKTKHSLVLAIKTFFKILPMVLLVILLIGFVLGLLPPATIPNLIGEKAGFSRVVLITLIGAVLHIPSIVSFPLAGSLLLNGASVTSIAAFITSLTMVGFVTLPLEVKVLGKKFAFLRNGFSLLLALGIALLMGFLLS